MSGSTNTHSLLSPSGASRWTKCTASVPYCHQNGWTGRSSKDSDEGTRAHDLAEQILTFRNPEIPPGFEQITEYTDMCFTMHGRWGGKALVEQKVPLFYRPEDTGTVDFANIAPNRITIVDLKWGIGVAVSAFENKQLAIYAQSLIQEHQEFFGFTDDMPVDICISQPRCADDSAGGIWTTTVGGLREFCDRIWLKASVITTACEEQSVEIAVEKDLVSFEPSVSVCRFCPAKQNNQCPHRVTQAFAPLAADGVDPLTMLEVLPDETPVPLLPETRWQNITDAQLFGIYSRIPEIEAVVATVKEAMLARAAEGNPVSGTKLVAGCQGNTAWIDDEAAVKALKRPIGMEDLMRKVIKSPTQILALVKGDEKMEAKVRALTHRASGKPAVALLSDKRPALTAAIDLLEVLPVENEEG